MAPRSLIPSMLAGCAAIALWLPAVPARAEKTVVAPACSDPEHFTLSPDKVCVPKDPHLTGDAASCGDHGGKFTPAAEGSGTAGVCTIQPTCVGGGRVSYSVQQKACVFDDSAPVSSPGDYVGDCLQVTSPIPGAPKAASLAVISQSADGKVLNVVPAQDRWLRCIPAIGADLKAAPVNVDDVRASGALRRGWVYGMLVAPFKFYPHSRELVGSSTLGPYLGWRNEYLGGALTYIGSAGISSVSGSTTDASGASKTVPTTAFSLAAGTIFEINKSKNPFRVGALAGVDLAGKKTGVTYANNGKLWLALQFGFDFTDL